ncbi:hypothetical protein CTAYLR_003997 [Chrysophaeum taylorii]|uniref:3'(2'),5'-bisphosphate nucleotidase n=1 Tax=Chrysophaeum taylorii TaxID=2483200 RepID=A0AAD7XIP0_9STRA|nr:hypothetical protein CTAYLR_003997 [Chrysophaeum taylorii]
MNFVRRRLGLVDAEEAEPPLAPLSEGAKARQEVLRTLLRTPACVGDAAYEELLAQVYVAAMSLAGVEACGHRDPCASWDAIGFQAAAPDREFRGGGMLGLHCLAFALEHRADACRAVIEGPFPFAAASINMTIVVARLAGVLEPEEGHLDPLGIRNFRVSESRARFLLESSSRGFFELHVAALEALERARRDVDAGPMDFAGCAAAARDEVAVLLAHEPRDVPSLRRLVAAVPRRAAGFLVVFGGGRGASRKWFTLSTGTLRWYAEADVHAHDARSAAVALDPGKPAGTLRLAPGTTVKFNQDVGSFSVYTPDGATALHALAADKSDMERWCVALTEHAALAEIDDALALARDVRATIASEPLDATFKVVETIGIYVRSAPDVAATRTGKALMPGDEVGICERRRLDDPSAGPRGRAFLKLKHDLGWEVETGLAAVMRACEMATMVRRGSMTKPDASPVTVADFAAQAIVLQALRDQFPKDVFIAEETSEALEERLVPETARAAQIVKVADLLRAIDLGSTGVDENGNSVSARRRWVLDPIDGTKGYLRGEQFCTALALTVDGVPVVSVLGCPNLDSGTYAVAVRGEGAFSFSPRGDTAWHQLRVSDARPGDPLRLVEGVSRLHSNHDWSEAAFSRLLREPPKPPIRLDSQAKALVIAQGKADCFIRLPSSGYVEKVWDAAPAALLVAEAGGLYTDRRGNPIDFGRGATLDPKVDGIIATTPHLHQPLVDALAATRACL